ALKVLSFASTLDPKQLQRFKNEAQAAARLHHQHIVPVYSVGSDRGVHYYAMQFIDGQTLAAVIGDLRQLSGLEAPPGGPAEPKSPLARQLASGRWPPGRPTSTDPHPTTPYTPSPNAERVVPPPPSGVAVSTADAALSTDCVIRHSGFFRTVASLAVQAAGA